MSAGPQLGDKPKPPTIPMKKFGKKLVCIYCGSDQIGSEGSANFCKKCGKREVRWAVK